MVSDFFPALIPFWITVHGLPLHYWTHAALESIGKELSPVEGYEVEKERMRVLINGLKPLEMKLEVSLAGDIKQVELEYDDLGKHCFICYSLTHEKEDCPSQRALANRDQGPQRMGISQARTLDRLEADRRKVQERKQSRSVSSNWQHESREMDWSKERNFRYNYGARRDPNYRSSSQRLGISEEEQRRPARERLSFSKEDISSARNESQRINAQPQRSEWRPIVSGSQHDNNSKTEQSLVSHTPSPRPPREGDLDARTTLQRNRQNSGEGSLHSSGRRSALERISLPQERIPLLQDGAANAESGRLQEVDAQYLNDIRPALRGAIVPSSSRNPEQTVDGDDLRKNLPSSSKNLSRGKEGTYDASQDRSPIRTLSEDRVHVSLRLGPLFDSSDKDDSLDLPLETFRSKGKAKAKSVADKQSSGDRGTKAPEKKKRGQGALQQGVSVKRRRVTKTQSSPKRRQTKGWTIKTKAGGSEVAAGTSQPRTTIIPATKKKGADFRIAPKSLP